MAEHNYRGDNRRHAERGNGIDPQDAEIERLQRRLADLEYMQDLLRNIEMKLENLEVSREGQSDDFVDSINQVFNVEDVPEPTVVEDTIPIYDMDGDEEGDYEAEVNLTGILSLGALQPGEVRKYGTMIAPGLYAPVHQHFFVARMDMSVDCKPGESHNQVVELDVKVEGPGDANVHNNAFYAESFGHSVFKDSLLRVFQYGDNDLGLASNAIFEVNFSKDIKIQGVLGPCSSLVDSRTSLFEEGENDAYPYDPGGPGWACMIMLGWADRMGLTDEGAHN